MSLLESDSDLVPSDVIGGNACVCVVQMFWGQLMNDCRLSDLDHRKNHLCQSGQKEVGLSGTSNRNSVCVKTNSLLALQPHWGGFLHVVVHVPLHPLWKRSPHLDGKMDSAFQGVRLS